MCLNISWRWLWFGALFDFYHPFTEPSTMLEYIEIDTPQFVSLLERLQEGSAQELPLHVYV